MSTDKVLKGTNIGLGAAIGLVIGPFKGFWLIRISNVGYLETCALGCLEIMYYTIQTI